VTSVLMHLVAQLLPRDPATPALHWMHQQIGCISNSQLFAAASFAIFSSFVM
jgi:hypothetical protein